MKWSKHIVSGLVAIFFAMAISVSCRRLPPEISKVLDASRNRKELIAAIDHFRKEGAKEELKACYYLISHLQNHATIDIVLSDTLGHTLCRRDAGYLQALREKSTSLIGKYEAYFPVKVIKYDVDSLGASSIIKNISMAYSVRRQFPWAKKLSDEVFMNYVLPHRIGNEQSEDWRSFFLNRYQSTLLNLPDSATSMDVYRLLNEDLNSWFGYDKNYKPVIPSLSVGQCAELKIGGCEEVANLHALALRAVGIPAAIEIAPFWGKSDFGHAEIVLLAPNGKLAPPDPDRFRGIAAKVFRKTYAVSPSAADSMRLLGEIPENIPPLFAITNLLDVTSDRTSVSDVSVELNAAFTNCRVAYICVYNNGEWTPIEWSGLKNGQYATFHDMGCDILYHIAFVSGGELILYGNPFVLKGVNNLDVMNGTKISFPVANVEKFGPNEWNRVVAGREYLLSIWDIDNKRWRPLTKKRCSQNGELQFKDIFSSRLYKLDDVSAPGTGRPFSFRRAKQIWW
ncbi:transglutaminase domain-containing protein [Chitinophaga lutea]|uniref:Transglutaminase domain-containing protein n=1 Tax=Chitinophaga lutea TaxID=2488634 RepID=A0A3N4QA69_9BACT|nr:transglutaminase-like domain-containing protein [Chitinophaga lutea]RPE12900.1 transglutaminase domain-containing protein [Chitinophaga lutea]